MPKSEVISLDEAKEAEIEIKKQIAGAGSNIADTVRRLNEIYGTKETPQAVTRQIKQGTLQWWKILRIADVLGYELVWKKKERTDKQ